MKKTSSNLLRDLLETNFLRYQQARIGISPSKDEWMLVGAVIFFELTFDRVDSLPKLSNLDAATGIERKSIEDNC